MTGLWVLPYEATPNSTRYPIRKKSLSRPRKMIRGEGKWTLRVVSSTGEGRGKEEEVVPKIKSIHFPHHAPWPALSEATERGQIAKNAQLYNTKKSMECPGFSAFLAHWNFLNPSSEFWCPHWAKAWRMQGQGLINHFSYYVMVLRDWLMPGSLLRTYLRYVLCTIVVPIFT